MAAAFSDSIEIATMTACILSFEAEQSSIQ